MTGTKVPTDHARLEAHLASRDREAANLADLHGKADTIDTATAIALAGAVKRAAERHNADYPQYDGYWDGWRVVRLSTDITTKGGEAFKAGDITIATRGVMCAEWLAYSWRLGWNVALGYGLRPVGGTFGEGPTV
jgi:hypothetical protein